MGPHCPNCRSSSTRRRQPTIRSDHVLCDLHAVDERTVSCNNPWPPYESLVHADAEYRRPRGIPDWVMAA